MSIRINLLPEARILKLKNQQVKRLVTVVCLILCSGIGIVLVVLLLLLGARNVQFSQNKKKIDNELASKVRSKEGIEQDLAWFNGALSEAYTLSDKRIIISQLFDRLGDATPPGVAIVNLSADTNYEVKASVQADSLNTVALFMNALRTYNVDFGHIAGFSRTPVFHDVEVSSVTKGKSDNGSNFEVTFKVDEKLVKKFRADATADETKETE